MPEVYLLTGSNRGDRQKMLDDARTALEAFWGPCEASSQWESAPWGFDDETPFLNQALAFRTEESPEMVLKKCLATEQSFGRERSPEKGYTSRTIDIDILFYGSDVILTQELTVPHPLLHRRRFALAPLNEIAPQFRHPMMHLTVEELLANCPDKNKVNKYADAV